MTEAEQLAIEMETSETARLQYARELLKHRRFVAACRSYRRSLPTRLKHLLDARYPERDLAPPPDPTLVERLI